MFVVWMASECFTSVRASNLLGTLLVPETFLLQQGDAIFFHSLTPSGEFDSNAFHTGCEVHSGVKWGATIWLHTDPFKRKLYFLWVYSNIMHMRHTWYSILMTLIVHS